MDVLEKVIGIARGHVLIDATLPLDHYGRFLASLSQRMRDGHALDETDLGALECIAGQMIGEAEKVRKIYGRPSPGGAVG